MDIDFVDIRIVSLEDDLTVESPENRALRYVYLKLSQTPPPLWQKHFAEWSVTGSERIPGGAWRA